MKVPHRRPDNGILDAACLFGMGVGFLLALVVFEIGSAAVAVWRFAARCFR